MPHFVYILHSPSTDHFYIGSTSHLEDRIRYHMTHHSGFTARAQDWVLVHQEAFNDRHDALVRERQLKNWKSKIRLREFIRKAQHLPPGSPNSQP